MQQIGQASIAGNQSHGNSTQINAANYIVQNREYFYKLFLRSLAKACYR